MNPVEHLALDCWKYRLYPCDFDRPIEAAHSQLGWTQHRLHVPRSETALLLMHVWNHGYPGGLQWDAASPNLAHVRACEWVARCKQCYDQSLPPIVAAARAAGIQIVHVASSTDYAERYEQYHRTRAEVTQPPTEPPPGAIKRDDLEWFPPELTMGPDFERDSQGVEPDFPPHLAPRDDDLVVVTTHELNTVLRARRIWHLTYCGFAINVCLWHSPAGMFDMKRLGYQCGCIRQGTVAVENNESAQTRGNHRYAMWWTSHHYGWVLDDEDYIRACQSPLMRVPGETGSTRA